MRFALCQHLGTKKGGRSQAQRTECVNKRAAALMSFTLLPNFLLSVTLTSHLWNSSKELDGSCVGMFSGPYLPEHQHHPELLRGS